MCRITVFRWMFVAWGFLYFAAPARAAEPDQTSRVDLYGDPLPQGAIARLGTVRFRQQDGIQNAAFTPDRRLLVVTSSEGLRYYDASTGKLLNSVPVEKDYVTASAVSRDHRLVVLLRMERKGERPMQTYSYHLDVFDVESGRRTKSIAAPERPGELLAVSGEGSTVAMLDGRGTLRIWDVAGGVEILQHQVQGVPQPRSLALSPQADVLAVGGSNVVMLWSWVDQAAPRLARLGSERKRQEAIALHFSPDGAQLAVGIDGWGGALLLDTVAGTVSGELSGGPTAQEYVRVVGFSPNGQFLATTRYRNHDAGILLWDMATRKKVRELKSGFHGPTNVAFSADGGLLAAVSDFDSTLDVWKTETGERISDVAEHAGRAPELLHFSRDGKSLVTAGDDGSIRFWDTATGRQARVLSHTDGDANVSRWIRGMAVSPDDRLVVSSSLDDTVRLWDAVLGKEIYRWPGHGRVGGHRQVAFSRDGDRVVSMGDDFRVYVWDVKTGKAVEEYRLAPSGVQLPDPDDPNHGMDPFGADGLSMRESSLSRDGSLLAFSAGSVHFFETATGKELRKLESLGERGEQIAISPDNRLLLECGVRREGTEQSSEDKPRAAANRQALILRRLEDGATVREIPIEKTRRAPFVFSPDGRRVALAMGDDEDEVRIYSTETGEETGRITELESRVRALALSSDHALLATSHQNGNVLIWDVAAAASVPGK